MNKENPERRGRWAGEATEGRGAGRHAHGGGGRRRKVFDSKELQLLILSLIAETPRHGYEIIRDIESRTKGAYAPSPGMVYPILTLLVDTDLAEEIDSGNARKVFSASAQGKEELSGRSQDLEVLVDRLNRLADQRERVEAAPVQKAMRNLKGALFGKLSKEGVSEDTIAAVAEIIDEAAQSIERLK